MDPCWSMIEVTVKGMARQQVKEPLQELVTKVAPLVLQSDGTPLLDSLYLWPEIVDAPSTNTTSVPPLLSLLACYPTTLSLTICIRVLTTIPRMLP